MTDPCYWAASKYIRNLLRLQLGTCFAAYNAGEYRVLSSIERWGKRLLALSNKKILPKETRNYIPKLLLPACCKQPETPWLIDLKAMKKLPRPGVLEVPALISLRTVAKILAYRYGILIVTTHTRNRCCPPKLQNLRVVGTCPVLFDVLETAYTLSQKGEGSISDANSRNYYR